MKSQIVVSTQQLDRLLKRLRDPTPALNEVGQGLKQSTQDRIRETKVSPSGLPFAPWSYSTLLARQKEGTDARGILFRKGTLFNAVQYQVVKNQVQVGVDSTAPYARFLQEGTVKMPARPFVGFSQQDIELIRKILHKHLQTQ